MCTVYFNVIITIVIISVIILKMTYESYELFPRAILLGVDKQPERNKSYDKYCLMCVLSRRNNSTRWAVSVWRMYRLIWNFRLSGNRVYSHYYYVNMRVYRINTENFASTTRGIIRPTLNIITNINFSCINYYINNYYNITFSVYSDEYIIF